MRHAAYIMILCGCLVFSVPLSSIAGQAVDLVKKAQEALTRYGMDPGPIDGIMGPRTESAIRKYQMENRLRETGKLDSDTQKALGIVAGEQSGDPEKPDLSGHKQEIEETGLQTDLPIVPAEDGFQEKASVKVDATPAEGENGDLRHDVAVQTERTSEISPDGTGGRKGHLRISTIAGLVVLSAMGLAALQPLVWILLTGGSLITAVWMTSWIGGHFDVIAYGVFAGAYILPVLCRLLVKSWDMALVFGLFLGTPVLLICRFAFGLSWWMAGCNGLGAMALLPAAYRRIFVKRRHRRPYGTLYCRF